MVDEVVVYGHRSNGVYQFVEVNNAGPESPANHFAPSTQPGGSAAGGGAATFAVTVNVEIADAAQKAGATATAQKFAEILVELEDNLTNMDPSTQIKMPDGHIETPSTLLNEIGNTKFIFTDNQNFNNGGVGGAQYVAGGANIDTLYWGSFASSNPNGGATYGNPAFKDQGLIEIVLHELVHMTLEGAADHYSETLEWNKQNGSDSGYVTSAYFHNGEAYANLGAAAIAASSGLDINLYQPRDLNWINPALLYHHLNPKAPISPINPHFAQEYHSI